MRILWLKTELLHPVDKGGKIRTYQMLKEIKKQHHVIYLTLDDGSASPDALHESKEYADETITIPHRNVEKFTPSFYIELAKNAVSSLPYALQKYVSPEMLSAIRSSVNNRDLDVIVCDFLAPAVNLPTNLGIPSVLFQHNVEAIIWRRHYEVAANPLRKAFMKRQWRLMVDYEKESCKRFDRVVAVSNQDADTIRRDYGIDRVDAIPTGVDTEFFAPSRTTEAPAANLVFTGSMDWLPNEDAIRWFVAAILPKIRREVPEVTLTVVGRNPSTALTELSRGDPAVIVTGRVTDVRPYMDAAGVYIVPIRIGGGTRLKIYEAMAMELPIVSTSIGAEGLPLRDGEEILLRDEEDGFADAVVHLLRNREAAGKIALQAAKTVRENFGWATVADKFVASCEAAIATAKRRPGSVASNKQSDRETRYETV